MEDHVRNAQVVEMEVSKSPRCRDGSRTVRGDMLMVLSQDGGVTMVMAPDEIETNVSVTPVDDD